MNKSNTAFIQGLLIGLIAPVVGFYFFVTLVLESELVPGYHQLIKDNLLTQVISISLLLDLIVVFVYSKRKEDRKIQGVVGAVLIYAVTLSVMYFM